MSDDVTEPTTATEVAVEESTVTTEEAKVLADPGKAALDIERKSRREAERERNELRERLQKIEDADKSEAEKAAARAEAAEKRANEAEAKALRLEIADELKVPAHLRKFLSATDEDALREQATDLLASLEAAMAENGPRQPKPDPSQGAKPNSGPDLDRQIAEALAAGDVAKSIALKRQKAYAPTT